MSLPDERISSRPLKRNSIARALWRQTAFPGSDPVDSREPSRLSWVSSRRRWRAMLDVREREFQGPKAASGDRSWENSSKGT